MCGWLGLTCEDGFMLGQERQRGLFDVSGIAPGLVDAGSVYGFLADHRAVLFPEEDFADLFPSGRGRPSVPAAVVGSVLLLQVLEGKTDRGAVDALSFDLRWKHACGWGVNVPGFHYSVLSLWRARLARSDRPDRVWGRMCEVVAASGALRGKKRRVVDSTVLDDAVARQDTVTLLCWQIRAVVRLVPVLGGLAASLAGARWYEPGFGKPDVDWSDQAARDGLVSVLVEDALAVVAAAGGLDGLDSHQLDAVGLLGLLAGQDVEAADGSDGTDGRWRIARRTAPDRVISVVDPDARHARKSRSAKTDGFKAHVVVEPDTGLATAVSLTWAAGQDTSDGAAGAALLRQDPAVAAGQVAEVLGDGAYASKEVLEVCDQVGAFPVVKPKPVAPAVPGGFTVDDFKVDVGADGTAGLVTCPAGHVKKVPASGQVKFTACGACPLRARCTTALARTFNADAAAMGQRRHRERVRAREGFADVYRSKRPMVERSISWLTRKARRVPYRGVAKNETWWKLRAAAVNLTRLIASGIELPTALQNPPQTT